MSLQRTCDWCGKKIEEGEVYYTVNQNTNGNPFFRTDIVNDICCDCAMKLSVDLDHEYDGIGILKTGREKEVNDEH